MSALTILEAAIDTAITDVTAADGITPTIVGTQLKAVAEFAATNPGPAGADGTNGTNGTNGTDGTNGTNGTNGTDGANYPQATPQYTGTALIFVEDRFYGSIATPETGDITADVTGANLGVSVTVIHNHSAAPTFDGEFQAISDSGTYVTGVINYIECRYLAPAVIKYAIYQ